MVHVSSKLEEGREVGYQPVPRPFGRVSVAELPPVRVDVPAAGVDSMKVRIRFEVGPQIRKTAGKNRHLASAMGALLIPVTLMAFVLFAWRLSSDLGLTTEFPIQDGLWSHWQVWLGLGLLSQLGTVLLNRYGKSGETGFTDLVTRALGGFGAAQPRNQDRR